MSKTLGPSEGESREANASPATLAAALLMRLDRQVVPQIQTLMIREAEVAELAHTSYFYIPKRQITSRRKRKSLGPKSPCGSCHFSPPLTRTSADQFLPHSFEEMVPLKAISGPPLSGQCRCLENSPLSLLSNRPAPAPSDLTSVFFAAFPFSAHQLLLSFYLGIH